MYLPRPTKINVDSNLKCGPVPVAPDPDAPGLTLKPVGDYIEALAQYAMHCAKNNDTLIGTILSNNRAADEAAANDPTTVVQTQRPN